MTATADRLQVSSRAPIANGGRSGPSAGGDGRADLSPELWALIAEHGYSPTAESKPWREWMLGCISDAGLELDEVGALLAAREADKRKPGTPRRDRLWSYKSAAWRDAIVGPMRKASEPEANPYGFTAEDLFNEGATC